MITIATQNDVSSWIDIEWSPDEGLSVGVIRRGELAAVAVVQFAMPSEEPSLRWVSVDRAAEIAASIVGSVLGVAS